MPNGCQLAPLLVEDPEAVAQQLAAAGAGVQRLHQHPHVAAPAERDGLKLVDRKRDEQARLVEPIVQGKERHDGRAVEKHRVQEEVRGFVRRRPDRASRRPGADPTEAARRGRCTS